MLCAVHGPPPSTCQISLDHSLQVYLQTHSIMASKCIPKLAPLQTSSSHNHDLQVHFQTRLITASKCIFKLARLRPPWLARLWPWSAYLQTRSITASKIHLKTCLLMILECIFKFIQLWPRSVSPITLHHRIEEYLQTCPIKSLEWMVQFTRLTFSGAPRIAHKHPLQLVQIHLL
jgi:hypothetical protein